MKINKNSSGNGGVSNGEQKEINRKYRLYLNCEKSSFNKYQQTKDKNWLEIGEIFRELRMEYDAKRV